MIKMRKVLSRLNKEETIYNIYSEGKLIMRIRDYEDIKPKLEIMAASLSHCVVMRPPTVQSLEVN